MPEQWLSSVLEEIKSCDPSSTLCATRRSAGIPFYIQVPTNIITSDFFIFFMSFLVNSLMCFSFFNHFGQTVTFLIQIFIVFVQPRSRI